MSDNGNSRRTRLDPQVRREAILEVAGQHFSAKPFSEVAVSHIAADVGVSIALVHKYFASKNGLFAAVLESWFAAVRNHQEKQLDLQGSGQPTRYLVVTFVRAYLEMLADLPRPLAAHHVLHGHDDRDAQRVREDYSRWGVEKLGALVHPNASARDRYALVGAMGAMQAGARAWVDQGCPEAELYELIDATVGGLQGALGDWKR